MNSQINTLLVQADRKRRWPSTAPAATRSPCPSCASSRARPHRPPATSG